MRLIWATKCDINRKRTSDDEQNEKKNIERVFIDDRNGKSQNGKYETRKLLFLHDAHVILFT